MNKVIQMLGNHIYKLTPENPERVRKELALIYSASGLMCKYFPTKKLLPARQFMQWAATDAAVKPLRDGKGAAIVSLYMPCEVLHAMEFKLMFPEALSCYLAAAGSERIFIETAENNGLPKTMCSYHKVFIGLVESGVLPKPDFIVNTTLACDVNHLSFRRAAESYNIPQYTVDVPREYSASNLIYVVEQLKEMTAFIEQQSGKKLSGEKLREVVARSKRTLSNFADMVPIRRERSLSDEMTSQMLNLYATHIMLGTENAEKYSADFLNELTASPKGKRGKRLLWVHTLPYWQDALRDLINFTDRCEIVACDMALDSMDVDITEEDPYRFMAQRLLKNTVNGAGENRIHAVCRLAQALDADGVVWYCHWGCKQTAGVSSLAKEYLERQGYPTLILDGDGCDAGNVNDGQTVTRMEAFLELLENEK